MSKSSGFNKLPPFLLRKRVLRRGPPSREDKSNVDLLKKREEEKMKGEKAGSKES